MTPTAHLAALKSASDAAGFQRLALETVYEDAATLEEAYEALVEAAEEAADDEEFAPAAAAFRKLSVMAWARDDNRMVENFATQALYYGTIVGFDVLLQNHITVWSMWAHMLPSLKARDRARLQDFARFKRSFDLGLRKREEPDNRVNAAAALLAPTFEKLGDLNLRMIEDRKAEIDDETAALWDEVTQLLAQIESSSS